MATVTVHEVSLTRSDAPALPARVLVHEIALMRTPPPGPGATVTVHGVWLTRNADVPVHPAGLFAVKNGAWVEATELLTNTGSAWG